MNKNSKIVSHGYSGYSWSLKPDDKYNAPVFTIKSSLSPYYTRKETWSSVQKSKKLSSNRPILRKIFKCIESYLENSTLHGLRYIGDNTISYGERLFWMVAFLCTLSCAVYFISSIYVKYNINPVIVSMNPTPTAVDEIPFPAVTICSMNAADKEESLRILANGTATEKSFLADICELEETADSSSIIDNQTGNWDNVFKFMTRVSQPCEEMLKVCKWRLKEADCNRLFNTIVTDEGLCCNFNQLPLDYILRNPGNLNPTINSYDKYTIDDWNPERGYAPNASYNVFPFRAPGPGAHLGLTLVLDSNTDSYYCSSSSSIGFKVLLHNPAEIPKMTDFAFMLPPGCEVRVVFKPTITDATKGLVSMNVNKRHCYFSKERYLKYYRTYTKINCKMECLVNITLKRCGCVPYYLPKGASTKVCGKMQEACSNNVREMMDLKEMASNEEKRCDCLPSCFQLDYEKSMSYGRIADNFNIKREFIKNASIDYFKKNMLVVQIYFVSTQFSKFTKSELYGFSEFLSNTGGILGLFLGFSALSVVEICYHFSIKLFCGVIRNRRNLQKKLIVVK